MNEIFICFLAKSFERSFDMSSLPLTQSHSFPTFSLRWIIGPRADLLLFIGGALASYLYIGLHVGLGVPMLVLYWIWSVGFDGTHIFGTVSRTYLDREERRQRGRLLFGSLIFFFSLGPTLVLLDLTPLLVLIVATWAYYHVIRQHYGFMVLYKKKNDDLERFDNFFDRLFLGTMLVYPPFQRFFIYKPQEMGIPSNMALSRVAPWLDPSLRFLLGLILVIFIARQVQKALAGKQLNLPKYLLMLAAIPMHWLTFHYVGPLESVPIVTIFHNIQYHGIIWYYNRNRYRPQPVAEKNYGWLPAWLTHHFIYFAIVALVFSALYRIPGFWLGHHNDLALGFFSGFGLTHYYLDSKIWRVRHDEKLNKTLKMATV
jgi:hypothetical protein